MTTSLCVGYIVEPPYPTFFVTEIAAVREAGVRVVPFNSFRPFVQPNEAAERLRLESRYFPAKYQGVAEANLRRLYKAPGGYGRVARFLLKSRLGMRLLVLSAYYAEVVEREAVAHLHGGYGTTPATVAMLTAWLTGRTYSFTCHAYEIFLPNPLLPAKLEHAAFVTTISEFNRSYIAENFAGSADHKIKVVRLGVDLRAWPPRAAIPQNNPPICLSVANLVPFKGHEVLLGALAKLLARGQSVRCIVVGDGPLRASLEGQASRLGLGALVTFTGRQDSRQVRALLEGADVFALPSVVDAQGNRDGIPVALMEAMAVGVPCVSSRIAGIPELIEDGVSGHLVEPGDVEGVADALANLAFDPARAARISAVGRERVERDFDLKRTAAQMVAFFQSAPR